jgi:hypothetical protein
MYAGLGGRKEIYAPPAHLQEDEVEYQKGESIIVVFQMSSDMHVQQVS